MDANHLVVLVITRYWIQDPLTRPTPAELRRYMKMIHAVKGIKQWQQNRRILHLLRPKGSS